MPPPSRSCLLYTQLLDGRDRLACLRGCLDRTRGGNPWRSYDGICTAGGRHELTCVSSCLGLATNFLSQSKQQGGSRDNGEWSVGDCDRTGRSVPYYRGPPPWFDRHPTRSFCLTSMVNVGKKQKLVIRIIIILILVISC